MLQPFHTIFLLVALVEIAAEIFGNEMVRFAVKPFLMPTLIAYYAQSIKGEWSRTNKLMVIAFFFSWLGDVALMFVYKSPNFFLAGLVSFLITHILYTISFADVTDKKAEALLPKKFWMLVPLLVYMGALLYLLIPAIRNNPTTQAIPIPVLVYTTAIATMTSFAMNRFKRVNDTSFLLVFSGAVLFTFSDSIIAVNRFLHPFPSPSIFIMVLYIAGQYLIARGMVKQAN